MYLLFVSCFADDYPTTDLENVENDDGGHDRGQHEPGDLMLGGGFGGYGGYKR